MHCSRQVQKLDNETERNVMELEHKDSPVSIDELKSRLSEAEQLLVRYVDADETSSWELGEPIECAFEDVRKYLVENYGDNWKELGQFSGFYL